MKLRSAHILLWTAAALIGFAQDSKPQETKPAEPEAETVVFRSDVALVRVDVQVLDSSNRAVTGLRASDFVLREQGKVREIRNFASEDMSMDVLLLLDVSGSMRVHVERIASAAHQAFQALGREDRVAIMVFDRTTRVRMPFRMNRNREVADAMDRLLDQERFNGGTDVTGGIYSAVDYMHRNSRKDARRAIVVMTDDQTEFQKDVAGLVRALHRDDVVLSLLLAPDAMGNRSRRGGGGGTTWPRGGGGGGSWPDIIWGGGGRRYPGGGSGRGPVIIGGAGTKSAGTDQVAEQSGGDNMSVDQASALEDTLTRLRQRYAMHFNLPDGVRAGQERNLVIDLSSAARRRYPDAELRYRRTYNAQESNTSTPAEVTSTTPPPSSADPAQDDTRVSRPSNRRPRISDPGSGANTGPILDRPTSTGGGESGNAPAGGWPKSTTSSTAPASQAPTTTVEQPASSKPKAGGWPRAKQP